MGRYALYGEIARGGMATVFFGRLLGPVGFSRTVAIKRLHPQYASDAEFVAMFLDEARVAARVQHPNVVSTLDVVALEGELMLVMEYVQGESLSKLLSIVRARGDRVPWRIVGAVMNGILTGLHAAHEAKNERGEHLGLVHRDMSPQNVLVGSDGVVRVFDFGVAKASGRAQDTRAGLFKGKLAYASPEQLVGKELDRRLDVYAASVILWEIVTGRRMFKAENEMHLFAMVKEGNIDPPSRFVSDLPNGLEPLITRGLATDPRFRFSTAREMAIALEEVLPHASAREVAEWVQAVAKEQLSVRAKRVEEIELTNPVLDSGVRDLMQHSNSVPPTSVPPSSIPSLPPAVPPSLMSPLSAPVSSLPAEPPRKKRGLLFLVMLLVFGSAGVGIAFATMRPSGVPSVVEEPQTGGTKKSKEKPKQEPELKVAIPDDPPPPAPVATETAAAPAPKPVQQPKAIAIAPKIEKAPEKPAPTASADPPKPANACSPPFTIDQDGIKHPKPECM
ncbi:MAG: serine/threonine-protein kinase [Polyangiales bacterium]